MSVISTSNKVSCVGLDNVRCFTARVYVSMWVEEGFIEPLNEQVKICHKRNADGWIIRERG